MKIAATSPALNVATNIATAMFAFCVPKLTYDRRDRDAGEYQQGGADHQDTRERACEHRARILRTRFEILRKCQADYSWLEQVKQRKHKNPDEIDKVPE